MKKMLCLLLVTCCFAGMLNAQNFLHEFGKFSQEEFDLKNYAKDTTAEAVVLYDIGKSFFQLYDNGYRLVFEHKTKLKIFKKSGFKFAQFEVPYYVENAQMEMIDKMAGNTYNLENGKLRITPLDPKTIFDEKTSDNWRRKKIALPDVKEG
ncbi:MAG: hypothetical protein LWW85_08295, partial [Marinilabiliales bacterium]|nr:hypothetical protein [Marinilabiliales bacterium]